MRAKAWFLLMVVSVGCGDDDPANVAEVAPVGDLIGRIEVGDELPLSTCSVFIEGYPKKADCDGAGQFIFRSIPAGRVDLRVVADPDAEGTTLPSRRLAAAVNPGLITDVGAVRIAPPGKVGGRVVTVGGAPVPVGIVAVPFYGAVTAPNLNGGYLLDEVPPGVHNVVLTTPDGEVLRSNVTVLPRVVTDGINFELADLQAGEARVIGRATRQLAADGGHGGLNVKLIEILGGTVVAETNTDSAGAFSLDAPGGVYLIRASDGARPATATIPFFVVHGTEDIAVPTLLTIPEDGGDLDGDGLPDATDDDIDGDGVPNDSDAFPHDPGESADADGDGVGDKSDLNSEGGENIDEQNETPDTDGDGLFDFEDTCPSIPDPGQLDSDGDRVGDACDNCRFVPNPQQENSTGGELGDACRVCIDGEPCVPQNACHRGGLSCSGQGAVCADTGVVVANGTPCGVDQVCNNGSCGVCMAGQACTPDVQPCHQGVTSCTSGAAVCQDTMVAKPNGTPCGVDSVCNLGVCEPCATGQSCAHATPCKQGAVVCTTGAPSCAEAGDQPDGTQCGAGLFCLAGECQPCAQGAECTPADVCHVGATDCSTGTATCVDTLAPAADGTACGSGMWCSGGICSALSGSLVVVSGNGQSATVNGLIGPVVLELTDGGGQPLAVTDVSFTGPAAAVYPTVLTTGADGRVTFTARLAGTVGLQEFTAATAEAPPAIIEATAVAVPSGSTGTIVNTDYVTGDFTERAPATSVRIGAPWGVDVAADGTIYFVDQTHHRVRRITPDGFAENFAGAGGVGLIDGVVATESALWNPSNVLLDEAANVLYVADTSNGRVRVINLSTRIITTYAGGGSVPAPTFGDGGPATSAMLSSPSGLAIGPEGHVYIADVGHSQIRRVDPTTKVIETVVRAGTCSEPVALWSCPSWGCHMVFDTAGQLFLSGHLCGTATGTTPGVMRIDAAGLVHHVAGAADGVPPDDGMVATRVKFPDVYELDFDVAGNLYVASSGGHRIYRIDGVTRKVTPVAGTGVAGMPIPGVDATQSPLNSPATFAFDGDDLIVADRFNYTLTRVPAVRLTTPTDATLVVDVGNEQPVLPAQALAPMTVAFRDNGPIAGARVEWRARDIGAGTFEQSTQTDPLGIAGVSARVGLVVGTSTFEASILTIHGDHVPGSPVLFTHAVGAPADQTIFAAVNTSYIGGAATLPAPGALAQINDPWGSVAAADGTLYFADTNREIKALLPTGELILVAGSGAVGCGGDLASALMATMWTIQGLALDPDEQVLYVADATCRNVRTIDLATGIIANYAGGGDAGAPFFGDGGLATSASLGNAVHIAVTSDRTLYIGDTVRNRVRKVDPQTNVMTTALANHDCVGGESIELATCGPDGCGLVADGAGGIFVTGKLCGSLVGTLSSTPGVLHVDATGAKTHIAGQQDGSVADGSAATGFEFAAAFGITRDKSTDDLYLVGDNTVWRIAGGLVTRFAGNGIMGPGSAEDDYGSATDSRLDRPRTVAVLPATVVAIPDRFNDTIRFVW